MAVALYLLSTMDETTPTWMLNAYFFFLGLSLGLIIQVLVIAVQNTASYADLGAATSGVTFFRSIGGSFGGSVFGAIFANQLVRQLDAALAGKTLPPRFSPATDLRRFGYAKLARAAGLDLPGGACWILTMLAKQGATPGPELARQAGVTMAEGHPNAQLLVDRGLITRMDGVLALTPPGGETAERLFAAKQAWLKEQLAGWSPEQHAELEQVLSKLSRAMLGEDSDRHLASR